MIKKTREQKLVTVEVYKKTKRFPEWYRVSSETLHLKMFSCAMVVFKTNRRTLLKHEGSFCFGMHSAVSKNMFSKRDISTEPRYLKILITLHKFDYGLRWRSKKRRTRSKSDRRRYGISALIIITIKIDETGQKF